MNRVLEEGHEAILITHRGQLGESVEEAKEATEYWLASQGIVFDEIHISGDKTSIQSDAMIEDKIENFLALEAFGVDSYLLDQPWNRSFETEKRVFTLHEFLDRAFSK